MSEYLDAEHRRAVGESPTGGVVAYVGRIRDGFSGTPPHRATFYLKKDGERGYSGCSCGDVTCNAPLWIEYSRQLLDAYEGKIRDFADETLRSGALQLALDEINETHEKDTRSLIDESLDKDATIARLSAQLAEVEKIVDADSHAIRFRHSPFGIQGGCPLCKITGVLAKATPTEHEGKNWREEAELFQGAYLRLHENVTRFVEGLTGWTRVESEQLTPTEATPKEPA